jgi:hypothetical protein
MKNTRPGIVVAALVAVAAIAAVGSADNFLIVNDGGANNANSTAIEAELTALSHTFVRMDSSAATALTPNDVMTTYNATFYMGLPSSGTEQTWCIALMDAGGNLLVADNDFGFNYGGGGYPMYTTYFESTYVSDAGSDGTLTGQGIMTGINPDISSDPYPDDFTIAGTNGTVIFDAPSTNAAGTAIERTPVTETYRGIYLAWDFQYTPAADRNAIVAALVSYLSQPIPVELMSFSIE